MTKTRNCCGPDDLLSGVPPSVRAELDSPGSPLDGEVRSRMEAAFGVDFSAVRVHFGSTAASSAHDIDALAYTHSNHIVFGAGVYAPHSDAGTRILAHELAHVIQQRGFRPRVSRLILGDEHSHYEQEADRIADTIGSPVLSTPDITRDDAPAIRRWKISGTTATADQANDTLSGLAVRVGGHFNDWKCIIPLKMQTFTKPAYSSYWTLRAS